MTEEAIREEIRREVEKLNQRHSRKEIELHKVYWLSEWSYDPLYEGYDVYIGVLRKVTEINGYNVYTTDRNCRYYFPWDIHISKYEAEKISGLKNTYLYDWCEYGEDELIRQHEEEK